MCKLAFVRSMAIIFEIIGHIVFGILWGTVESDESPLLAKILAFAILAAFFLAVVGFVVWVIIVVTNV